MPNVGSLVEVNFKQRGDRNSWRLCQSDYWTEAADSGNFQPSNVVWTCLCLSSFCFRWFFQEGIYRNSRLLYWKTQLSVFWQVLLQFRALHPQRSSRYPPCLFSVGRNAECRKGWLIRYGRRPASGADYCKCRGTMKPWRTMRRRSLPTRSLHAIGFWLLLCYRRRRYLLNEIYRKSMISCVSLCTCLRRR